MQRRLDFARALAVATLSPLLTRLRPALLARILEPKRVPTATHPTALADAERALAVTGRLLRHTCYTRGVTRFYLLRRSGFDAALVFGLDPTSPRHDGHCWIVLGGEPYREPAGEIDRFVPTWSIGAL
jgi:hypothetical protein